MVKIICEGKGDIKNLKNILNFLKISFHDKNILTELHNLTKPEKPYDFKHQNFNELKTKLKNLFEEQQ